MITRIRIEAEANSIEQAKREIDILMGHAKLAALLEGIGSADTQMSDEHYGANKSATRVREGAKLSTLPYEGRQVTQFGWNPVVEGGVKQYGFAVLDTEQPSGVTWSISPNTTMTDGGVFYMSTATSGFTAAGSPATQGADVTHEHIVLRRVNKASREHTWETEPPPPPRTLRVADVRGKTGCTVEWNEDDLVGDVAQRAADEISPKQAEGDRWTFKMGEAVLNPMVKADDYLVPELKVELVKQNPACLYWRLGSLIPVDHHKEAGT